MVVNEPRRIALHRAATESWGEEVADTLVELVAPSGHELATRQDVDGILTAMSAMDERSEERLKAMDQRWDERLSAVDGRLVAMDERWDERLSAVDGRLGAMDERWQLEAQASRHELLGAFERRIADAVTHQTRTLVFSQLGALVVIAALAFGLR